MVEAVIWDLDGVLVNSLGLRIAGLRYAAAQAGASPPDESDLRRWLCHGPSPALKNIPGANTSLRDFERYCRRVAREYIVAFEDIDETLGALQHQGFRQGLVTSRTASDTDRWLALCGLSPAVFDVRITYSNRLPSKPNPGGLLAAAERLGVHPSRCVYLGDTIDDGVACDRAGIPFLLAGWGAPDVAEIVSEVSPASVLESPLDILPWVHRGVQ